MSANVAVRFSVEDQEVVRKALEDLGKAGEAALKKMDDAGKAPSGGMKAVSTVVDELKGKLVGLAVPLGPIGSGLLALGPGGLVAAAGLGAVITAVGKMNELANELATKAGTLSNFAELTGLSTDQIQALDDSTVRFGKSADQTNAVIERSVQVWDQLRRGQGDAFDQLRRIDPELLNQLAAAKNVAAALDILAKAYANAGDQAQKNALASAFGGRGGATTMGALLTGLNNAGGLSNLTKDATAAGAVIDKELIQRLATLKNQIKDLQDRNKDTFSSLFSENQLQAQKDAAELIERVLAGLKGISDYFANSGVDDASIIRYFRSLAGSVVQGLTGSTSQSPDEQSEPPTHVTVHPAPAPPPPTPSPVTTVPIEVQLRNYRDYIAALGAAATPTEQLRLKTLELDVAQKNNVLSTSDAARASAAFSLAINQSIEATRERIGIATQDNIVQARMAQLRDAQAKGIIQSDAEFAAAEQLVQREARNTADALEVRNSAFKGLKQLQIDGTDLAKSLDTGLTGSLNGVEGALVDLSTGTTNASDGFANLEKAAIRSLEQMVIRMTITASLAKALSAALGALGIGGGSGSSYGPITLGSASGPTPFASANGNVFSGGNVVPFRVGGVVRQPIMFPMANGGTGLAGEAGDEGILPLTRINGVLGVHAVGGGGSGPITVNLNNAPAGSSIDHASATPDGRGGISLDLWFANGVRSVINGDLANGTGVAPNLKQFAKAADFKGS